MPRAEEWDWPPPRRTRPDVVEGESRVVAERIILSSRQSWLPRNRPLALGNALLFVAKLLIAAPIAVVALAALWLMATILTA